MFKLYQDLAERRVFRFVVAYAAFGWALLEVVDQLTGNGILPGWLYRASLALVLCGFPGALIVSWFHGAKGRQEVPPIELWLLGAVAIFAVVTTGFVARSALEADMRSGVVQLADWEDPSRVAVMYFEPRGGGDAEFLASGLTESLIDELTGVEGIHVVSRNGSQLFRGVPASADSIGRALSAGTIVSGTVAQAGDEVRVNVTMANAATGNQYANREVRGSRTAIFELQDSLASLVGDWLRSEIGAEVGDIRLRAGTSHVAAWEAVQKGEQTAAGANVMLANNDIEGAARELEKADSVFAAAESIDPQWTEPILLRGWLAYRQSRLGGMDRSHYLEWIDRGVGHAERALALDPTNASALELRGTLRYWKALLNLGATPEETEQLKATAESDFRGAIASDGARASALTSLSHLLLNKGEVAEAKLQAQRAYNADPFLENANLTLWRIFTASYSLGDAIEAPRYCAEGARRFPTDYRFAQCQLMLMGMPEQPVDIQRAWQLVDEFAELSPPQVREVNRHRGYMYVGMALARDSLADSARAVLQKGRAGANLDPLRETALLESIARTILGDGQEAVRQLSIYLAANPAEMEGYQSSAERGDLPWYHQALLDEPGFRSLLGLR